MMLLRFLDRFVAMRRFCRAACRSLSVGTKACEVLKYRVLKLSKVIRVLFAALLRCLWVNLIARLVRVLISGAWTMVVRPFRIMVVVSTLKLNSLS